MMCFVFVQHAGFDVRPFPVLLIPPPLLPRLSLLCVCVFLCFVRFLIYALKGDGEQPADPSHTERPCSVAPVRGHGSQP